MMPCLLDVTLREAGLVNDFSFSSAQVQAIVTALDQAGMDIIEVGYFRPKQTNSSGISCSHQYLDMVKNCCQRAALSVMVHSTDVPLNSYRDLAKHGISIVRFAVNPHYVSELSRHTEAVLTAGLTFTVNAVRSSEVPSDVLVEAAQTAQQLGARCFFLADSNGSLYPEQIEWYSKLLRSHTSIALGLHAHDNLRLAFANTLVALRNGFEWIDSSLGGAGKGGGNLMSELIAGYITSSHFGGSYDVIGLAEAYSSSVVPTLRDKTREDYVQSIIPALLNWNIDQINELKLKSKLCEVSFLDILSRHFKTQITSNQSIKDHKSQLVAGFPATGNLSESLYLPKFQ